MLADTGTSPVEDLDNDYCEFVHSHEPEKENTCYECKKISFFEEEVCMAQVF